MHNVKDFWNFLGVILFYQFHSPIPPLWSRGNIFTSHIASPGSIPGRVSFLVEIFLGISLHRKTNVRKFVRHSSPAIILPECIIRLRTATVFERSSSTWPSLNNKRNQQFHPSNILHAPHPHFNLI